MEEIIEHHIQRKDLTLQSVTPNSQLPAEISKKIFGDALSGFDRGLALNETYVHLLQLEKRRTSRKKAKGWDGFL